MKKQPSILTLTENSDYLNNKIHRKTRLKKLKNKKSNYELNPHWHHNLGKFLLIISVIFGFGGFGFGFGIRSGKIMPLSIDLNHSEQSSVYGENN
jgi:site-specific recombinase